MMELANADPGQWTGDGEQTQELEALENVIDALPAERMPGEVPVSLDGRTGQAIAQAGNRGVRPAPDLTRLSVNNPLSHLRDEFDDPDDALTPFSPSTPQPGQEPQAEEARNDGPWPQFRLRPTSELDRQVYAVQKSLGVDVETALEIARGGEADGRMAIGDLEGLDAEAARVRAASGELEAALRAEDLSAEARGSLETRAAEAGARLAELEALRGPLAEAREALEAEFEGCLARVARAYPDLAEADSPLRRAMADVRARWELLGEWEKLESPRQPLLAVAEARQELLLNPARYARTASAGERDEVPSYEFAQMRPAPGRVSAHPSAPTRFGEMVAGLATTHDLEELLAGV